MVSSALSCATKPEDVEVLIGLNYDDPQYAEYSNMGKQLQDKWPKTKRVTITFEAHDKGRLIWNFLAETAIKRNASWVWIGSDDVVFETKGWDERLRDCTVDFPRFVWGNDGSCGDRHATHPFLNAAWLKTVGKAMPECCQQYDGDTFITELGKATGLGIFDPEIVTRHMNHKYGLGTADETWKNTKPLQKVDYDIYRGPLGRAEVAEALANLRRSTGNQGAETSRMVTTDDLAWRAH